MKIEKERKSKNVWENRRTAILRSAAFRFLSGIFEKRRGKLPKERIKRRGVFSAVFRYVLFVMAGLPERQRFAKEKNGIFLKFCSFLLTKYPLGLYNMNTGGGYTLCFAAGEF